ncbi:MAG: STAS domain-containing protein [Ruminococcus sp.]|nr:STAS domain-containing protein [Ruminococcus sp.]
MIINKEINGTSAVLKPEGWLDTPNSAEFKEAIDSLPDEITELTVDMEKLEYISSAGLRLIVAAHKKMNGALTVTNASVEILDVFRMTGFDKRLNLK